jgi:hypothetical protein
MNRSIGIVLLSLTAVCCTRVTAPDDPSTNEYYPLQVGNRWIYASTNPGIGGTFIDEVVGIRQLGEHQYFAIRYSRSNDAAADTSYLRIAEDGTIRIYRSRADQMFVDFRHPVNHRWPSYDGYWGVVQERGSSVTVPAGTFPNCLKIFLDIPFLADDEQWYTFAQGIGPIERKTAWFGVKLVSAKVGSRSYP